MTDHRLQTPTLLPSPGEGVALATAGWQRAGQGSAGRLLALLSVVPALLTTAWLVAAFPLAAIGQFRAFLVVPLAVLAAVVILPRGTAALRRPTQPRAPWWATAATAVVAIGFAVFAAATHSQQAILRRDAGSYAQIGWWLGEHHGLTAPITSAAFGSSWVDLSFASPGFYVQGDAIVPQFMTGWPTMLAAASWVAGWPGMFVLAALVGGCMILAVAGLAARLIGPAWAPLAALLVALAWPVLRVSQTPYSEPLAGLVLAGGLCLLMDALALVRQEGAASEPLRRRVRGAAFVVGLVWSTGQLVRLDMGVDIALLVPIIGWWWFTRRPGLDALLAGTIVGGVLGVADSLLVTLPYVRTNWSSVRLMLVGMVVVVAGTVLTVRRLRSRGRSLLGSRWWPWLAPAGAVAVVVLAAGLVLRPYLHVDHSNTNRGVIAYTAEMQSWLGLPIDGTRGYAEHSLWWVSWYLGWPLLGAALVGATVLTFRVLRVRDVVWIPFLLVYGVSVLLTLIRPGITPDHPWADRRLVVEVIPALVLLATWTVATAAGLVRRYARTWGALGGWRAALSRTGPIAAGILVIGLVATFVAPILDATAPMAGKRTELGEVSAANAVCQALQPKESVVLLDPQWVPTIRGQCGLPVAQLPNPSAAGIERVAASIRAAGRTPVIGASRSDLLSSHALTPTEIVTLHTQQDQHQLLRRPDATDPLVVEFWLVRP